jgi:hypothetical protein
MGQSHNSLPVDSTGRHKTIGRRARHVPRSGCVEIPAPIEQAVSDLVARRLEAELGDRGLLLAADEFALAEAGAAQCGARVLTSLIHRCYPITRQAGGEVALDFGSERGAARLQATLAFGATTARVLQRDLCNPDIELVCAIFNLGIGLVDGLCDEDPETGDTLLQLVQAHDLADAAEQPRVRGWLRATLLPALAEDPAAAFTADVIETFFETLHDVYPHHAWRLRVGVQLVAALEAERASVTQSADPARDQLIECSRLTSVLPFQIIETLADAEHARAEPTAGTQLGEAMWRIDDLVDLCQDARSGSLNGVLLCAGGHDVVTALERLLASTDIARAAREAADDLQAGLQRTDDPTPFLYFVQRYAGITPRRTS